MARHRLTGRFLAHLNKKDSGSQTCISAGEPGIRLHSAGGEGPLVPWDQITKVVAFKRDVYAHDLICLLIEQADGSLFEIDERAPGWMALVNELPIRLPAARAYADWFKEVAFPAFDTSPTSVFVRH